MCGKPTNTQYVRLLVLVCIIVWKKNTNKWIAAGKALREALWDDARISTTAAGALPFYSQAWTLDQSGLCDRHIAKVESDPWLLHKPGHQKQATRRYLSSIEPALDIIVHHPFVEPATRMSSRTQSATL